MKIAREITKNCYLMIALWSVKKVIINNGLWFLFFYSSVIFHFFLQSVNQSIYPQKKSIIPPHIIQFCGLLIIIFFLFLSSVIFPLLIKFLIKFPWKYQYQQIWYTGLPVEFSIKISFFKFSKQTKQEKKFFFNRKIPLSTFQKKWKWMK